MALQQAPLEAPSASAGLADESTIDDKLTSSSPEHPLVSHSGPAMDAISNPALGEKRTGHQNESSSVEHATGPASDVLSEPNFGEKKPSLEQPAAPFAPITSESAALEPNVHLQAGFHNEATIQTSTAGAPRTETHLHWPKANMIAPEPASELGLADQQPTKQYAPSEFLFNEPGSSTGTQQSYNGQKTAGDTGSSVSTYKHPAKGNHEAASLAGPSGSAPAESYAPLGGPVTDNTTNYLPSYDPVQPVQAHQPPADIDDTTFPPIAHLPIATTDPQNAAGDAAAEDIPIDSNTADSDSAFGDAFSDDASSLASLESWVARYRMENGRRFHSFKDGAYLLPNDEPELDRLDLHHHIFQLLLKNKLHLAPLQSPHRVLDVGTGTGIWAIDFADEYPSAQVIGIDLSPVQPSWVPSNIEFQIDDVEDNWTHRQGFDYIHIRSMAGSIGNWRKLLRQAYDHLNPGGWLEVQEFEVWIRSDDDSIEKTPMIKMWQEGLCSAAEQIGKPMLVAPSMRSYLLETGFADVQETIIKTPQGPWARGAPLKEIGMFHREQMKEAATSYGLAHFTRVLGWKLEEYNILATKVRSEMMKKDVHLYSYFHDVYGRKPGLPVYPDDGEYHGA